MTITVISQTTAERREETAALYQKCLPYLDQGYSIHKAAWKVTGTQPTNSTRASTSPINRLLILFPPSLPTRDRTKDGIHSGYITTKGGDFLRRGRGGEEYTSYWEKLDTLQYFKQ